MTLDELKKHCLKSLKQTEKFPTKTFEEHALVLRLIENQTSVIAELEKIKAKVDEEIEESLREAPCSEMEYRSGLYKIIDIFDNRISELKGE